MKYPKLRQYIIGAIDESAGYEHRPEDLDQPFKDLAIPESLLAGAELALDPYPLELCRNLGYYGLCPEQSPEDFAEVYEVVNRFF